MNYIKMSVEGNRLSITEDCITTSGSMNYDGCKFTFDSGWEGFTKTAVFSIGGVENYRVAIENGECIIPSPCIEKEGILRIGVFGISDNDTVIATNSVAHRVDEGVETMGAWIEENTELVINAVRELKRSAEEYSKNLSKRVSEEIERLKTDSGKGETLSMQSDWYTPDEFTDSAAVTLLSKSGTEYEKFLDFRLNSLLNDFPEYVTRETIGTDASGDYTMYAYSFAPAEYEKTIFIATCLHGSDKCALISLSHFLDCLCRSYQTDRTLGTIHNSVKICVIPAVNPYAIKSNSTYNKNGINLAYNFPYHWDICTRYKKGDSAADQKETQNVIAYLKTLKNDKLCAALELHTNNLTYAGRTIYYARHHASCATALADLVNNFNYNCTYSDYTDKAILAASNNAYLSDYIADEYGVNSCQLVWTTNVYGGAYTNYCITKYAEFIGNAIRVMAANSRLVPKRKPQPFIKHISWKSSGESDVFTVNSTSSLEKMPISSFKLGLDAPYNISLHGYVRTELSESCTVKINPVFYQVYSGELDFKARKDAAEFTQELELTAGTHIIPISSVLQAYYNCYNFSDDCKYSEEVFFTLMLSASVAGKAKVTAFAVTLEAAPSDIARPVEISSPIGLCSDYSADDIPTQKISYPLGIFSEYDPFFNN